MCDQTSLLADIYGLFINVRVNESGKYRNFIKAKYFRETCPLRDMCCTRNGRGSKLADN